MGELSKMLASGAKPVSGAITVSTTSYVTTNLGFTPKSLLLSKSSFMSFYPSSYPSVGGMLGASIGGSTDVFFRSESGMIITVKIVDGGIACKLGSTSYGSKTLYFLAIP